MKNLFAHVACGAVLHVGVLICNKSDISCATLKGPATAFLILMGVVLRPLQKDAEVLPGKFVLAPVFKHIAACRSFACMAVFLQSSNP